MKFKKIQLAQIITLVLFLFLSLPWGAKAATPDGTYHYTFNLNVPIGELGSGCKISSNAGANENNCLGLYIKAWYGFLLGTVGIIAAVMIMWGGFKYLTSRGDKASIDLGKSYIISAITGIVLAFGAFTLLSIINPQLMTINIPALPGIRGGENVTLKQISLNQIETNVNSFRGAEMVLPQERSQITNTLAQSGVAIQQPNIDQTRDDMTDIASFSTNAIASLSALGVTTPDSQITLRTNPAEINHYRNTLNAEATFSSDPSFLDYVSQNVTAVYRGDTDGHGNMTYTLLAPGTPTGLEDIFVLPTASGNIGVSPLRQTWDHWAIIDMKKIIK